MMKYLEEVGGYRITNSKSVENKNEYFCDLKQA
jgi:hypothetical protein